jgi:PHD/YefM family antitoxin component YafN of YafNO toxin-antitoxin module
MVAVPRCWARPEEITVAADDHESMAETDYLLRSPANATRLITAANEARHGRHLLSKTTAELESLADEDELPR